MRDYRIKITKEKYEQYNKMSYSEQSQIIEGMLPQSIICGYGFYGYRLEHDTDIDKYFIVCQVGDSCD